MSNRESVLYVPDGTVTTCQMTRCVVCNNPNCRFSKTGKRCFSCQTVGDWTTDEIIASNPVAEEHR